MIVTASIPQSDSLESAAPSSMASAGPGASAAAGDETLSAKRPSAAEETAPGAMIDGRYCVVERLGSGGMGTVFRAEQLRPVHRLVALKIVKLGMDTKQVIARFESERQALASMDHPNIAKVYDAGAVETGRPYFSMELVDGFPLTEYCERHRLSTRERLSLFMLICRAVQHAHQRGLIHRDLKPSNVLVAARDGAASPKIIDFGIAKATHRGIQGPTLTEQGQFVGTPEYMSPEQAECAADIDTRTDVYSLGAILYELLIGVLPLESGVLRAAPLARMQQLIRETEPLPPSARLDQLGAMRGAVAQSRRTDPRSLSKSLGKDLDWITMKAIARERELRYGSVSELCDDVGRYLRDEPVSAGPPSAARRVWKLVRRHRLAAAASALSAVALLVAVAGLAAGLTRARTAERRSREAESRAKEEARAAQQVSEFLEGLFEASDPNAVRGKDITVREILDRGATRITGDLKEQPLLQARLMETIGKVYDNAGLYEQAIAFLQAAVERRRALGLEDGAEVANALRWLGDAWTQRGDYDRALPALEKSLTVRERLFGPSHPSVADAVHALGLVWLRKGDDDRSRRFFERALAIRQAALPPDDPALATSLNALGANHYRRGDLGMARELWERSLAIREKAYGPDHSLVMHSLNNLALLEMAAGETSAARARLERVIELQARVLGPKHADLAASLVNLGDMLVRSDEASKAVPLLERAIEIQTAALAPSHPELARALERLGSAILFGTGDVGRARPLYERSLAIREKALGSADQDVAYSLVGIANCERRAGRFAAAEALFKRALPLLRKPDGSYHAHAQGALFYHAGLLRDMHRPAQAAEIEAIVAALQAEAKRK